MSNNPWAGLASYQDPASGSTLLFCGRDNESYDLAALVDDNIFCTLYGKSGTGKTSLLNAGMFPRLRDMGYLPLSIRLGMEALGSTFQQCIAARLGKAATLQTSDTVPQPADDQDEQWLWAWFARTRFVDGEGKMRFPVLVFDQFEEVFRSRRTEAETLLRQVHFMMDPSHSLGDDYDYNFRFLASIREDDLYLLEDSLDRHFMGDMKQCRYRLNALSDEGARNVILKPGEGLFAAGEQDEIVDTVIGIARSADGSINTNILSLVCSRIYDHYQRSGDSHISLDLVKRFVSSNPFEQFYNEVTENLGEKEKQFIEDRLVDAAGRRGSVSEPDFEKNVPNGAHLLEGTGRILQRVASGTEGRSYRIELIHDSFCAPLADQKLKRAARRRRRITIAVSVLALVVAAVAAYIIVMSIRNARLTREVLIQQEKFYAKQASQLLDEGDTYTAFLLLNELTDPDGPFAKIPLQPEAECQMRRAVIMNDTSEWRVERTYQLQRGIFMAYPNVSSDGKYLVEFTSGALLIYDFRKGHLLYRKAPFHNAHYFAASFSHDGRTFACANWYGSSLRIVFLDIETGTITLKDIREVDSTNSTIKALGYGLMYSSDDQYIFGIIDTTICKTCDYPHSRQKILRAFSVKDSTERYLQDGEDVNIIETGNEDGTRIAAMQRDGEILIYDKNTFQLLYRFHPGDFENWKYISDDVLLFGKKDGLYKYTLSKKKTEKIANGDYHWKSTDIYEDYDWRLDIIQESRSQFCYSHKDTLFIHDKKSFSLVNTYILDTTKYLCATLCDEGNLLLMSNNKRKLLLVSHHPKQNPQEVNWTGNKEIYINGGKLHISIENGFGSDGISLFQIRDVETNEILFSDTTNEGRDVESLSPNGKYLITEEWKTLFDANGDTVHDSRGNKEYWHEYTLFDIEQMRWVHTFDSSDFEKIIGFTNEDNVILYYHKNDKRSYCYNINTGENRPFFADSLSDSICFYDLMANPNSVYMFVASSQWYKTFLISTKVGASSQWYKTFLINTKTHKMQSIPCDNIDQFFFTPDGRHILTTDLERTVRIHNASNFSVEDSCSGSFFRIRTMHPNGNYFIAVTFSGELELWSLFPLKKLGDIGTNMYSSKYWYWRGTIVSFCDDGKNLVFCSGKQDKFFKIPVPSQQEIIEKARTITRGNKLTEEEKNLLME